MFTVSMITSPLELNVCFFFVSDLRGGGFMHAKCKNIICMQMILKIYSVTEKNFSWKPQWQNAVKRVVKSQIWSVCLMVYIAEHKWWLNSNLLNPVEQALYMVPLCDSIAFTSVIGKKWYRKWVKFAGCYSYSVLQCRGPCLSFETKDRETQGC